MYIIKKMKVILVVISFVVLLSGVVYTQIKGRAHFPSDNSGDVLSVETDKDSTQGITSDNSSKNTETSSYTMEVTKSPTPIPTITPTHNDSQNTFFNSGISEFIYPGSEVVSSTTNSLSLTSGDSPDKITSWYKEKITSKNMNVKTFVTTKANDKIVNKLVGAQNNLEVSVEITTDATTSVTHISVDYRGS